MGQVSRPRPSLPMAGSTILLCQEHAALHRIEKRTNSLVLQRDFVILRSEGSEAAEATKNLVLR